MLSPVRLFGTSWTVAHQASLSKGFPRQEYWSGLPFPTPGDLSIYLYISILFQGFFFFFPPYGLLQNVEYSFLCYAPGLVDCLYIVVSMGEKAMAPHSSTLAWKIPWKEEPGGLQSMGSLRGGHD